MRPDVALKRQVPRLRDWNHLLGSIPSKISDPLETTSTSITRLKHVTAGTPSLTVIDLKRQVPRLRDWNIKLSSDSCNSPLFTWNDKYLDYEIETTYHRNMPAPLSLCLETTSTSITRLKPKDHVSLEFAGVINNRCSRLETTSTSITRLKPKDHVSQRCRRETWNDKYLDYEIETRNARPWRLWNARTLETTSTSITRLKLEQHHGRQKTR